MIKPRALCLPAAVAVLAMALFPACSKVQDNTPVPHANSGHLAPLAALAQLGVVAERDFASVEFTRSHGVSLFNLVFNQADVAGVSDSVLKRLVEKHRQRQNHDLYRQFAIVGEA